MKHKHNFIEIERLSTLFNTKIIYKCEDRSEPRGVQVHTVIEGENGGSPQAISITPPTHYEIVEKGCGELRSL
jgi:hypothetical protein